MKIAIFGAAGRMGQMIAKDILLRRATDKSAPALCAAVDSAQSWANGKDIGGIVGLESANIAVTTDKRAAFAAADVVIDFTSPVATAEHAALAAETGKALVVGTTGLGAEQEAALAAAARKAAVLRSANMSLGVNLLLAAVEQIATRLGQDDYDIEIFEAHHRHKIDAPSGTALMLGHAAAKGRGVKLEDAMIPARFGEIGARIPGSIGISVFRGGDVVGDHTVTFAGTGEQIALSHRATDRAVFARGAITAAQWLHGKPAGLYSMKDVLSR